MFFSDRTIYRMLESRGLKVKPLQQRRIQPASVNICRGDAFGIVEDSSGSMITMEHEIRYETLHTDECPLLPGQLVLTTTMEYIALPGVLDNWCLHGWMTLPTIRMPASISGKGV